METTSLNAGNILHFVWQPNGDMAETHRNLALLTARVAQKRPFGLLFEFLGQSSQNREAQKVREAWLKANRAELAIYCFGVAVISSSEMIVRLLGPVVKLTGKKRFGCPCEFFLTKNEAEYWLKEQQNNIFRADVFYQE